MFRGSDDDEDYLSSSVDYMSPSVPQAPSPVSPTDQAPRETHSARTDLPPQPLEQTVAANPDTTERAHMLGFGLIASSLGAVAGLRIGGAYGGVAGTLFAGSAVNMYRAALHAARRTPEGDREAIISGTYSLLAAGLGAYVSFKTADWRKDTADDASFAPALVVQNRKQLKGFY